MASIRRSPSGNWQASIYMGRDETGKKIYKYVTRPTLKECKKAAWEIEQTKVGDKIG